jgi:hypothetical protein
MSSFGHDCKAESNALVQAIGDETVLWRCSKCGRTWVTEYSEFRDDSHISPTDKEIG